MLKVYVRKSVFGNGEKIVKESFAKLKAEVISILRKKDSEEVKKALEYFEKDEHKYTHLENQLMVDGLKRPDMVLEQSVSGKGRNIKKLLRGNG